MTTGHITQNVIIGGLYIVFGRYLIQEIAGLLKKPVREEEKDSRLRVRTLVHPTGCRRSSGVWMPVEAGR